MTMSAQTSEAWDLALQARYHWNQRTPQGLLRAAELYEQATAKDPGYAPAHAGLAATWALSSGYLVVPQEEFMPQAREAALQAIALDEGLADAHSALALVLQHYDLDWLGAERQFRRAVELGPNDATAHHWLAEHLGYRARFDEAFAEIEMAEQLDPLSRIIAADHAALLYFAGQLDRSIERFEAVLEKEPMLSRAYMVTYAYALSGRLEKAFESVERWRRVDDSPWILAQLAWVQGRAGRREDARRTLTRLEPVVRDQGLDLSLLVVAELGAGDDDRAITLLEEARRQRSPSLVALAVDPIYDPLRENPRFERLLRSLGLAATESP